MLQAAQSSLQVASGRTAEDPQGKGGTPWGKEGAWQPQQHLPGVRVVADRSWILGTASWAAGALVSAWLWSACCSTENGSTNPGISPVNCFHREQLEQF